jgi:hypothetical protein
VPLVEAPPDIFLCGFIGQWYTYASIAHALMHLAQSTGRTHESKKRFVIITNATCSDFYHVMWDSWKDMLMHDLTSLLTQTAVRR